MITELRRFPELVYAFKHGLLQECALSTLPPARREELYGVVAAAFEDLYLTFATSTSTSWLRTTRGAATESRP